MVITTTAIAFILLALGLSFCGWLFLRSFHDSKDFKTPHKIKFWLSFLFLGFGFQNAIMGFGFLFFAQYSEVLYYILVIDHIFITINALIALYTAYYIFFPTRASRPSLFLVGALGIVNIISIILSQPRPFITEQHGIDLDMSLVPAVLTFLLLAIAIGTTGYIFTRLFLHTKGRVRILSLIIVSTAVFAVIQAFVRLVLLHDVDPSTRTGIYDLSLGLIGIVFIFVLTLGPVIKDKIISFLYSKNQ